MEKKTIVIAVIGVAFLSIFAGCTQKQTPTANNTTNIATAVLDRLQIIPMPSYTDQEKTMIAQKYILPKVLKQTGLSEEQLTIDPAVWSLIIRPLGFDSGIRSLERAIEGVCRKAAMIIVEKKATTVKVDSTNVKQFLPAV